MGFWSLGSRKASVGLWGFVGFWSLGSRKASVGFWGFVGFWSLGSRKASGVLGFGALWGRGSGALGV